VAILVNFSPKGMGTEQYDEIIRQLEQVGAGRPPGRLYHIAYGDPAGLRVVDLWESPETLGAFGEKLIPILESNGVTLPPPDVSAAHAIVAGDPGAENKSVARQFLDGLQQAFRTGITAPLDSILAPDFRQSVPGIPPDRAGFLQVLPMLAAGLGDFVQTVDDMFAAGDCVADRTTWSATHRGPLMGIPPTGKRVTVTEVHIVRIADGKVAERWGAWDQMGLMQQLGVIPAPGRAA